MYPSAQIIKSGADFFTAVTEASSYPPHARPLFCKVQSITPISWRYADFAMKNPAEMISADKTAKFGDALHFHGRFPQKLLGPFHMHTPYFPLRRATEITLEAHLQFSP